MNKTRLYNTSLRVSDVALGTGAIGSRFDDKISLEILDCYMGLGGNFIDTANVYGRWNSGNKPLSEILLGKWMKFHHLRNSIILATKGAADDETKPGLKRLAPEQIRQDLEDSLNNLQTDYIDLYYLHQDDPSREISEILETMNELLREGKIRYFACSNWTSERMQEADSYAKLHNLKSFVAHEIMFNLASANDDKVKEANQSHMNDSIFQYHHITKKPVTAYTSQAAGFFELYKNSGFSDVKKFETSRSMFYNKKTLNRAKRVDQLCGLTGITPLEVTLAYLYAQPFQVIPIVGPWNVKELESSINASEKRISMKELEFLISGEEY